MTIRLAIRGFVGDALLFADRVVVDSDKLDEILPALALKHARAMADHRLHMIEIEFLDEPDPNQRFFRISSDSSGMVFPIVMRLQ